MTEARTQGSAAPQGLRLPPGWRVHRVQGRSFFATRAEVVRPDGTAIDWSARRHRKGLAPLLGAGAPRLGRLRDRVRGASASSWWMGVLFMAGAFCFALGSIPLFFESVAADLVAWVFFVGSIFFTTAAYLQFRECVAAPESIDPEAPGRRGVHGLIGLRARSIGWWASGVQLVGTIFFNVSTLAATRADLALDQERHLIWVPDFWGSVCFLIASALAYLEVCPRVWTRPRGDLGWQIAALNLGGSIAFGLAAIGARYLPTTGEPANIALVNLGTFVGAVCFFVGAALLPVESAGAKRTSNAPADKRTSTASDGSS